MLAHVAREVTMNWIIGNPVIHRTSRIKGQVIDVNNYWGWYVVKFVDGHKKVYTNNVKDNETSVILDLSENFSL